MASLHLSLSPPALGPFTLGDTLFETLSYLRGVEGRRAFGQVAVAFDDKAPATGPVLLTLLPASIGLTLVFASPTQTLAEIGLPTLTPVAYAPPAGLTLTSGSNVLLGPESGPLTKRDVARIFGPTFDASSNSRPSDGRMTNDAVWYPGLGFGFALLPTDAGVGDRDVCRRIWVCDRAQRPVVAGPEGKLAPGNEPLSAGTTRPGALTKALVHASSSSISLVFAAFAGADRQRTELVSAHGVTVHISVGETTTADLLAELGAPSQTFEKVDDRLGIHRPASSAGAGSEDESAGGVGQPYFWNYFHLGLDILILPTAAGHLVHKLVVHSNLPGAVQWGRYERCPWAFATPAGKEVDVRTPVSAILKASSMPTQLVAPAAKSGVLAHVAYPTSSSKTKAGKTVKASPSSSPSPSLPSAAPSPGASGSPNGQGDRFMFEPEEALRRSMPLDRTLDGSWGAGVLLGVGVGAPPGSEGGGGGQGRLIAAGTGCVLEVIGDGWVEGIVLF